MESLLDILNLKDNIGVVFLGIFLWYVISSFKHEFREFKSDMKEDLTKLESKLESKIDSVKVELNGRIDKIDLKIDSVRDELKKEFNSKFDKLSTEVSNLDRTVIRFESHRELENRFEKMLSDTVAQQLLAEKKAQSNT